MYQKLSGNWDTSDTLRKYLTQYNIDISHWRKQKPKLDEDCFIEPKTDLQKKMLSLRKEGKSFQEIADLLNCSKSTVSYFFRPAQRKNTKKRKEKYTDWEIRFIRNISSFQKQTPHFYNRIVNKNWNMKLRSATNKFIKRDGYMSWFGYKDVLNKYNNQLTVQCYLTGDMIDLTTDDFAFDHIIPISRGGDCSLNNLAITTYVANQAKSSMTEDEFVELCLKVVKHHGYRVEKDPQ